MVTEIIELIANITILFVGLNLLAFIFMYARYFQWRTTAAGRSVMYFVSSLTLLISLAAFLRWLPTLLEDQSQQILRLEVYLTIAAASVRMLVALVARWWTGVPIELPPLKEPRKTS